jgi:glycerol kinase
MFAVLRHVVKKVGAENIVAVGITNQRETTVLWDSRTGRPVCNAIVWQCRRTKDICDGLRKHEALIKKRTGLFLDPYFSATKIKWVLDNVPKARQLLKRGRLRFGTIDTWAIWNLSDGRVHATDPSNASRTLLYNINTKRYDKELLKIFGIKKNILPEVKESAGDFGAIDKRFFGRDIPIAAVLGDQQASLFAHTGPGAQGLKNTYGTGLFVMQGTGRRPVFARNLVTTVAWALDGRFSYALEGSIFVGGSAIQWLRDGLKVIKSASDSEKLAMRVGSNEGVYFVPALAGLGAPYWNPSARGTITGLTRGSDARHLARAALEAMAYQTRDVIGEMKGLSGAPLRSLSVDGGAVGNDFLMQFQSDILGMNVARYTVRETTALGIAGLAGIHAGFWGEAGFIKIKKIDKIFRPKMSAKLRKNNYDGWKKAVKASMSYTLTL